MLIFENGYFYVELSNTLKLKIPDEESKKYHTINEIEYIDNYIITYVRNYKEFPMLYFTYETNLVLKDRILTDKGLYYLKKLKEIYHM